MEEEIIRDGVQRHVTRWEIRTKTVIEVSKTWGIRTEVLR